VCARGGNQLEYESQELTWNAAAVVRILLRFLTRNVAFSDREVGNLWVSRMLGLTRQSLVPCSQFSVIRVFS
jgi:hypothetical protein